MAERADRLPAHLTATALHHAIRCRTHICEGASLMSDQVLKAAMVWWRTGASVLPAAVDGTKRPRLPGWLAYKKRQPNLGELADWFSGGQPGFGVVCGAVSGNLEMIEFEGRAVDEGLVEKVAEAAEATGLGPVWTVLSGGYTETSPGGGLHLFWRLSDGPVPGNMKIAQRPSTPQELIEQPDQAIKVLIETRGEGGWVVCAPSGGPTHPSGGMWRVRSGTVVDIPTVDLAQRDELVRLMRSVADRMPRTSSEPPPRPGVTAVTGTGRPGDEYEAATTWEQILVPHGWQAVRTLAGTTYWRRPGKRLGISATTGNAADRDRLYVFSSSTPFTPETPYTKFGAYATLEHGGDFRAAAAALRGCDFGDSTTRVIADLVSPGAVESLPASLTPAAADPVTVPRATIAVPGLPSNPTELDVARLMARMFVDRLRYTPGTGWFAYDGVTWVPQDDKAGVQYDCAARACAEAQKATGKEALKWGAWQTISAVLRLGCGLDVLQVSRQEWDPDENLLNTPGGVVDLRTGGILANDPKLMCTRVTAVAPDPRASGLRFHSFVNETFCHDRALMDYVQSLLGYSLYGHCREQVVPLCHGGGNNGKSVLLNAVLETVGTYGAKLDSEVLMIRPFGGNRTEPAVFDGPRIMFTSEVSDAGQFDERRIKELSGGDQMTTFVHREMGARQFTVRAVIWMLVNTLPGVREGGDAFFRRVREIPFVNRVPADKVDPGLAEQFRQPECQSAILAWLLAGAQDYYLNGLRTPAVVADATALYSREAGGAVGAFAAERCHIGGGDLVRVNAARLYEEYLGWAMNQDVTPLSRIHFGKKIRGYGAVDARNAGSRQFANISLRTEDDT